MIPRKFVNSSKLSFAPFSRLGTKGGKEGEGRPGISLGDVRPQRGGRCGGGGGGDPRQVGCCRRSVPLPAPLRIVDHRYIPSIGIPSLMRFEQINYVK